MPGQELIGRKLGDYTIVEMLGQGGMAHVYKGLDANLQRYAALKVIETRTLPTEEEPEYRERFLREARAIARLSHPRIVGVYQFGQTDDQLYYMAMHFVPGRDLRFILKDYIRRGKRPGSRHILRIIRDIAGALDYAHRHGVIHRDVKPSNIMITQDGSAILTDFGLVLTSSEHTLGNAFGSVHYVAPEQALGSDKAVPQSDLYSLGVVLYEMMTGRVPFDDKSSMSVALKQVQEPPPLPRSLNSDISIAVEDVILTALDKSPENRYQTGAQFVTALENALMSGSGDDTQDVHHFDSKSRPIVLPNPSLLSTGTHRLVPSQGDDSRPRSPLGSASDTKPPHTPVSLPGPLSATPTGASQRTRLDPDEQLRIQEMKTITDSSRTSQLRNDIRAELGTTTETGRVTRDRLGLVVAGVALALIASVVALVLLLSSTNDSLMLTPTSDSLAVVVSAVITATAENSTGASGALTEEPAAQEETRTTSSAPTVDTEPLSSPTVRRSATSTTGTETASTETTDADSNTAAPTRTRPTAAATPSPDDSPDTTALPADVTGSSTEDATASPDTGTLSVTPTPALDMSEGEGRVLLRYDGRSLILYNRDTRFTDVSNLDFIVFEEDDEPIEVFNSSQWGSENIYVLRHANCLQLWRTDFVSLNADEFPADICQFRQAFRQADQPFWVGKEGETFIVERNGIEYATCPRVPERNRADNRCVLMLP